jgi:predicted transcriptional regulator
MNAPSPKRTTRLGAEVQPGGARAVPGIWLETLAVDMKLTRFEWRVLAVVLARQPVTAWQVARILGVEYSHVKRAVRELVRWKILSPSPEGLRFQPDKGQWGDHRGPAAAPGVPRNRPPKPSKKPGAIPSPKQEEEVVLR